jgi:hypothetical protein
MLILLVDPFPFLIQVYLVFTDENLKCDLKVVDIKPAIDDKAIRFISFVSVVLVYDASQTLRLDFSTQPDIVLLLSVPLSDGAQPDSLTVLGLDICY